MDIDGTKRLTVRMEQWRIEFHLERREWIISGLYELVSTEFG